MRISVVIATYNQPSWLEKVLWGYAHQTHRNFELIVADDGSTAATAVLLERLGRQLALDLVHVWHQDRGFRKCEILNRALLTASGEYVVFSDGDCIPRHDFLAVHAEHAAPERFLSGGYLKLPAALSHKLTYEDIRTGRFCDVGWLRQNGWSPGRRAVRLLSSPRVAGVLDLLTPTRASWNGHNASTWREALVAVNGFDAEMKYGGEDRALGERLENLGYRGLQIRYRAPVLHLEHGRPYVEQSVLKRNRAIRDRIAREREVRAVMGIKELHAANEPVVTRRLRGDAIR